jgi:magnesium transporter
MSDAPELPELQDQPEADESGVDLGVLANIIAALGDGDGRLITSIVGALHPADASDILEQLSPEQFEAALKLAPQAFSAELLSELTDDYREEAVAALPVPQLAQAVAELESDDATLILEDLEEDRLADVLAAVPDRDREAVVESLSHEEETAGRLMQREFVAAPEHWTVGDAIDHLRAASEDDLPGLFFEIYVVDPKYQPVGAVPLSTLMRTRREVALRDIMAEIKALVTPELDREDVAYLFQKYHLAQAPAIDEAGRLKGMLTVDDIVDVIHEEGKEDLLALAGVSETSLAQNVRDQVRTRTPWLIINLCTAIGASLVISIFSSTIEAIVALAILMPIVSALGGSAGAQTVAVIVSSIASRDLTSANTRRVILREAGSAALIGLVFAVLLGVIAVVWFQMAALGLVIAIAMALTMLWGGLSGVLVPLTLRKLGADPVVASSVFVTATTDMVGFFIFLGLASWILL